MFPKTPMVVLSKLWDGICDVYVLKYVRNEENGRDEPVEEKIIEGEPCRLSFSTISNVNEEESAPTIQQTVKLFISKLLDIPAGSKIVVTQEGRTNTYQKSGEPAVYSFHQEIVLVPFERYA